MVVQIREKSNCFENNAHLNDSIDVFFVLKFTKNEDYYFDPDRHTAPVPVMLLLIKQCVVKYGQWTLLNYHGFLVQSSLLIRESHNSRLY